MNGGTGVGVVEAYDLDRTVNSELANIATRGVVRTENNVMIGGLIVLGDAARKVLVRAIGPSLPSTGSSPIRSFSSSMPKATCCSRVDNGAATRGEITCDDYPPTDEYRVRDCPDVTAGAYTAVVSGVGGITGIALVEVYASIAAPRPSTYPVNLTVI